MWNIYKLFVIGSDPIIQFLNILLSCGIYFEIEDKKFEINIKRNRRIFLYLGIILFVITILRSFFLNSPIDKYYYLLLPCGITSISLMGKSPNQLISLKKIILVSSLLPLRRIFFYCFNPLLLFLTKYLTWFFLIVLGNNPILIGNSIFIGGSELVISEGCGGADNMFFAISSILIYKLIFSLRNKIYMRIIYCLAFFIPLIVNVIRNTLLALIITISSNFKDKLFYFFHDSFGSLFFSFISLAFISYIYFNFLDRELKLK